MKDSNYTLRFPRTSRDAFGYQIQFEKRDPDKLVGIALVLIFTFLAGMWAGGVM